MRLGVCSPLLLCPVAPFPPAPLLPCTTVRGVQCPPGGSDERSSSHRRVDRASRARGFEPGIRRAPDRAAAPSTAATPRSRWRTPCAMCPTSTTGSSHPSSSRSCAPAAGSTATATARTAGSPAGPSTSYIGTHHRGQGDAGDDRQQPRLRCRALPVRARHLRRVRPGLPELDAVPAHQTLSRDHGSTLRPSSSVRATRSGSSPRAPKRPAPSSPTASWSGCSTPRRTSTGSPPWAASTTVR